MEMVTMDKLDISMIDIENAKANDDKYGLVCELFSMAEACVGQACEIVKSEITKKNTKMEFKEMAKDLKKLLKETGDFATDHIPYY